MKTKLRYIALLFGDYADTGMVHPVRWAGGQGLYFWLSDRSPGRRLCLVHR